MEKGERLRTSRIWVVLVLLLCLGMVAAACSKSPKGTTGSPSGSEGSGTMTIGSDKANDKGTESVAGKDQFELELDNFYFKPTVLKGTLGQELKIELSNDGSALHNFTLEAQSIDHDVQSEKKADVTVTFPQSGFLEFFCKYHRGLGMAGELST
jgi:plastocyanin